MEKVEEILDKMIYLTSLAGDMERTMEVVSLGLEAKGEYFGLGVAGIQIKILSEIEKGLNDIIAEMEMDIETDIENK